MDPEANGARDASRQHGGGGTGRARRLPWLAAHRYGPRLTSEARKLAVLATHRHAHVEFQGPVRLGPGFHLEIPDDGSFIVGPAVDFRRGFYCEISGNGTVRIGSNCVFTFDSVIQCSTSIEIGDNCSIGQCTMLVDGTHRFRDPGQLFLDQGYDFRPITIGCGATIMTKATVYADVGERAVVGANAVVTRPVPAYCLAVGVPARVVEYFGPPELRPAELDAG